MAARSKENNLKCLANMLALAGGVKEGEMA
jgi:hypothetical protein